jgi:hypothetical protein
VLTYEAVAGIVLLLPLLYRARVAWRPALARWRFEALAAGAAMLLVALATTKPERGGSAALEHATAIGRQGASLAGRALAPWHAVPPAAALALALGLVALALAVRRSAAVRPALGVALSLAALVLAWAPFVPGEGKYVPGAAGIYDRVNIVAGFALAALVCSLAALAGKLVPAGGRAAAALPVALVAAVGAGWLVQARERTAGYDRAAAAQRAELAAVDAALPRAPARGTVVVLFHDSAWAAPGVPTFGHAWDLSPALKLRFSDASIRGIPVAPGERVECRARALAVAGDSTPAPYARAVLVDARSGRGVRVSRARGCEAAVAALRRRRASA